MGKNLVREINNYAKGLKGDRDWQVSRVYALEHKVFKKEKTVPVHEANKIVKNLERHWKLLITQIYPEYDKEFAGETWAVSKKAAAINISDKCLYPSVLTHEVSHAIVECCTMFHNKKLKEPGHGPLWCGVYAYNIQRLTGIDMYQKFEDASIRVANPDTILKFRDYFINA